MITAVTLLVLFFAVQIVTYLAALLFSNLDMLGSGVPISELQVPPVNLGISMFVGELLLAFGLWWWFYRIEKPVRLRSVDNPELAGIFKFRPFKQELTQRSISKWQGIVAVLGTLFLALGLSGVMNLLHLTDNSDLQLFKDMLSCPFCLLLICIFGPLAEELTFRVGILRSLYGMKLNGCLSAGITALLFALVHGNLTQGIPGLVIGFVLGLLYLRTGDLRLCLPAHICNNTLGVICMYYPFDTTIDSWQTCLFIIVSLPLLILGLRNTTKKATA